MRFVADGPSIPDDLLLARDRGRVIFFCGAGVSRARANLPDFFGLAKKVISTLGVSEDSPACRLIREAQTFDTRIGVSGIISADRVFGLLERDFLPRDIEAAVALALKPATNCDLSAHEILLDLATTQEGIVRLVTTNFDRLFDDCERNLPAWQPPRLPNPSRPNELNGIVYLHGRATLDYGGAEKDGFVLSSSEFGRAYLSDGWATSFFREIIQQYVVVFVGYTADDPPVHYLLEALNKTSGKLDNVYAFQSGGANDAASRWRHKGVEAIAYDASDGHRALWQTLELWAERARNPDNWYSAVINAARNGPQSLAPHERGQVAHVVSTYEGAKRFSEGDSPPGAEWLCVFDPARRFAKPGHQGIFPDRGPYIDPFDLYGLDFDIAPNRIDPDDHHVKREIAPGSWDAFALNRSDWTLLTENNFPSLRGHWAAHSPRLAPRLHQLGIWIAKVSNSPAAVWWAAHQAPLHPDIRDHIRRELDRGVRTSTPDVRHAWRFLFEAWGHFRNAFPQELFELKAAIAKDGWNNYILRQYIELRRPFFTVEQNYWGGPTPPTTSSASTIRDLFRRDVAYPEHHEAISIPDDWVAATTAGLRENLERALVLETEIGGYGLTDISPIAADDTHSDSYSRTHGLSAAVIEFASVFSRLAGLEISRARQEFNCWPTNDDTIFARLRIWASGHTSLVSPTDFGDIIGALSDEAFWDPRHQRDLLLALSSRWKDLDQGTRQSIERRLLLGPVQWKNEADSQFQERKAFSSLNRIHWLSKRGIAFCIDLEETTTFLRSRAPKWKPEYIEAAAESLDSRSGTVRTKTDYDLLLKEPLSSILSRAKELSGRTEDFLVEKDPFAGLCTERPVRAFSALIHAAKAGEYPEWAWQTFLSPQTRKDDNERLTVSIATRLVSYPEEILGSLMNPVSDWLSRVSKILAARHTRIFDKIVQALVDALYLQPTEGRSRIIRGNHEPDWTMEAINAPVGKIAEALFDDPRKDDLEPGKGFPMPWLENVERLLALSDDMYRHAIVLFFHNLNWFYSVDPAWTEQRLLSVFDKGDELDQDAAWAGFLWDANVPSRQLYTRLKPEMLAFAKRPKRSRRGYGQELSAIILAGWSTKNTSGERLISNQEMRSLLLDVDDDFRERVLWQIERWSKGGGPNGDWAKQLPEFLRDVWPRQISAKSATISVRLCDLAFSDESRFVETAELILPLLTKIDRGHLMLPNLRNSKDNIVDLHPAQTLALLDAVLPDNAAIWPYGIDATIKRIGEADSNLNLDERLISLKRKLDAR